jgi:cation diffusion facilitator CzcD-associated flavoprotein CzcO
VASDIDVIVFATGFDIRAPLGQFDIQAHGTELNATLEASPEAYYGLAVSGFPNLFTLLGLNTGLGHHSVVFMAECQVGCSMCLL